MEEGLSFFSQIKESFQCGETDIKTYSPLTLAYIGDGIYDIIIRTVVVGRGNLPAEKLHKKVIQYVNAGTQAVMIEAVMEELTEEEETVYRRGRNAKSYTRAKNAAMSDYRKATGFEALMGYLYLQDKMDRAIVLIKSALAKIDLAL